MKKVERIANAVTERGTEVALTVTAVRGIVNITESADADGYNVNFNTNRIVATTKMILTVGGKEIEGKLRLANDNDLKNKGVYALFNNIGLSKAVYEKLNKSVVEAEKEAETDADWQAFIKSEREYNSHRKTMKSVMSNGFN